MKFGDVQDVARMNDLLRPHLGAVGRLLRAHSDAIAQAAIQLKPELARIPRDHLRRASAIIVLLHDDRGAAGASLGTALLDLREEGGAVEMATETLSTPGTSLFIMGRGEMAVALSIVADEEAARIFMKVPIPPERHVLGVVVAPDGTMIIAAFNPEPE